MTTIKPLPFYNLELLKKCIEKDNPRNIVIPEKFGEKIKINYFCECGSECNTEFRTIYRYGMKCHNCKLENGKKKREKTFLEKHGVKSIFLTQHFKEKADQTNIEKYGTLNPMKNKEIRKKYKNTNLKRYGKEFPSQCNEIKEKIMNTCSKKYGVKYVFQLKEVKEKTKETNILKYGVKNVLQNHVINQKRIDTNIKKYGDADPLKVWKNKLGINHCMEIPDIFEKTQKTSFRLKSYKFPNGKEVKIQGYENYALDSLINIYKEDEIFIGAKNVPKIFYSFENKKKRYYTDIYITKNNLLIEVKSKYTMEKELNKNLAKRKACVELGYDFQFWIYDKKLNLQIINKDEDYTPTI
jgi:hypothetical protein